MEINWDEWNERQEFAKKMKIEQKRKMRDLLESDIDGIKISLREFVEMCDDDNYKSDMLDIFEEALMKIADGQKDPVSIAQKALKTYYGEDD